LTVSQQEKGENPVELNIVNEVAALERLSVGQLRQRFAELFGETTKASNRTWLIKRIVWRLQALTEGDLSERARRRAAELARDADLRLNPPQSSQAHEGCTCLPDRYDDGGFTGGNMERPALQRLLADIAAGKIDLVVTYKVDRLSRSLLDFAKMMETFEQHGVSFVSVTQQFNTATSMGRLVLNVLLSFAQFEREIIAERTRDKMAATRRKGKWSGGMPVLGHDLDPRGRRLHVNDDEAIRVRAIFVLYLEHQALLPVVQELARRGWVGKRWQTRHGRQRGGRLFTKTSLYRLLTNVLYAGKVRYKDEVHQGEQPALIDADTFQRVQALLRSHGPEVGPPSLHRFTALLKGLLRCVPCDCAMTPAHTTRKGGLRYRYYTCVHAQKSGWQSCPSKSIPTGPIEQLVVEQIQRLGRDSPTTERTNRWK
jgi:site-specific DNA recombinase